MKITLAYLFCMGAMVVKLVILLIKIQLSDSGCEWVAMGWER